MPGSKNPLKITEALKMKLGNIKYAKTLRDGNIMLICRDEKQREKALRLKTLASNSVKCSKWEERKTTKGVIYGIPTEVSEDEIKKSLTGAKVCKVKRMQYTRDGVRKDSLSVMIQFEEEVLPTRVMVGFMSYNVREYVAPPLRCFKCQRYGHVAAICKGRQRCGKCAGEHQYGECGENVKLQCCNCGGEHSSAYGGCEVRKRAIKVQNVKMTEGISYADAIKRVKSSEAPKINESTSVKTQNQKNQCRINKDSLVVDKIKFVTFVAEVINCSAQTTSRTERIKIIIRAAEKYLDIRETTVESVKEALVGGPQGSQATNGVGT